MWICFLFSCARVELLGHMVTMFNFSETDKLCSTEAVPSPVSLVVYEDSTFSTFSPTLVKIVGAFKIYFSYLRGCEAPHRF